ncbi:MAG: hypothetical protein AAGA30_21370, partial [Planctomycetota bacterium]
MNSESAILSLPQTLSVEAGNYSDWLFSKQAHFKYFKDRQYDLQLFGEQVDPDDCNLKVYQDLLTYGFLVENFSEPVKILDIGGGESRILNFFKNDHEC